MEYLGKTYGRKDLLGRVGSLSQIGGIRDCTLNAGRAAGVRMLNVDTGPLQFDVLADRCLDVYSAKYKGTPFGYLSKSGVRHPAYFSRSDPDGFTGNFAGGLVCTCGLANIGSPRESGGKRFGTHGEISNIPAENVCAREEWTGDECAYEISGEMRHASFYGEDLLFRRTIAARLGEARFSIDDEVVNLDAAPAPCMTLYHINLGFPFLDASSLLITSPLVSSRPRPGTEAARAEDFRRFTAPVPGAPEACVYHEFEADAEGNVTACLFNPDLGSEGMGVYVTYGARDLPVFVQWTMLRNREYVCGFAPATVRLEGSDKEDPKKTLLAPFGKRTHRVTIGVVEGREACEALCRI